MKHARLLLLMVATLLCSISVKAQITDVSQLSNTELYFVSQPGHASGTPTSWVVLYDGNALQVNSQCGVASAQDDANQQFAFLSNDGGDTHYLYHPVRKMFVNKDGSLGNVPMNAVHFMVGNQAGTFVVYFDASSVINTNDNQGLVINRWGPLSGYGAADAGNSCAITPVGEFDPSEALAMFSQAGEEKKKIIEFKAGTNGWIEGADWYNQSQRVVGFTSPLYQFSDKVETLRITVNRDKKGDKFFCLSELAFYDTNGQKIELTADAIVSNADHNALNPNSPDGGGIPALLDGETTTFFHSAWRNMPNADHYLEITLPNGGYDAFSFKMLSRDGSGGADQSHTFPGEMVMTTSVTLESVEEPGNPGDDDEPVESLTRLSAADPTKCYTVTSNGRGAWAVDAVGAIFSSTSTEGLSLDAADARQQFAILSANGTDYYLYSVSAKKFVTKDASLVPFVGDAIALADASSIETGRVQVRFRDYSDAYINLGNQGQMTIDSWGTIDNGNAVLIAEAGDFDAAEAMAILVDPEGARKTYLVAQAQELLAANADNHAERPALGQYGTGAYENLAAIVVSDTATAASVEHYIAAFEASKCLPVFTIDGVNDYAAGMSIYDDGGQYPRWKATDSSDETMLWAFDMTDTIVGVTDKVVIRNLATGNLFMEVFYDVAYIRIAETTENIADDGLFLMFREEDTEFAIWASQSGVTLPSQGIFSANSTSAWKFTYVGTTYGADYELPDTLDTPVVPDTTVTETYNWAGIYTVEVGEIEVLNDDFRGRRDFGMEVVYYQETNKYLITDFAGYGVIEANSDGGILLTPSADDPNKAVIDPSEGVYLITYDDDRGWFRLTDTNLTNTPLTITRLEDGTFTISDFCVSNVIHGTDSTGAVETPAAYYRDVTAVEYTKYAIMPINYYSGLSGWITGATMYDEDNRIVGYTSPLYRFEDKVETFRMTVNRNGRDNKYFCLSELEFYDSDGNRIELTEENVTSNADHNTLNPNHQDGGGIPALFDGDTQTYFHSAWENMPAGDHYLQITLPNGGYDAFSFRMLSRAYSVENGNIIGQEQTFPAVMVIDIADTPHRDALEVLLNRAKGYNPYSGSELGYYVEDFSYLLDAIAEAEALLLGEPSEADCEAMVAELSQAVEQFESSDRTFRLPEPGKVYRIVSALPAFYELQSVEKAITINASDNTLWWGDLCPDSLQQEFVFEPVLGDSGVHLSWNMDINLGNGTTVSETQYFYNLKNVATGLYASYNDSAKFHLDEQPCTVYLTCLGIGQFGLKFRVENEYGGGNIYTVHAGDHNEGVPSDSIGDYGGVFGISSGIVSWYGGLDTPSAWYIREYPVQTDTVPSLQLVGVTPDSETSESWVRALTLSFNKEVYVWNLSDNIIGKNTGEEFHISSHRISENSDGGFDLTLYLGDANDGWTKMITVPDTYTYTIPAGAIKSVDGEDLPETTITFTVDGTFPVVSYSPAETTSLEQIELTFDKVIEEMNIYYGWDVYNEEGDAVAYIDWGSGRGSKTVTLGLNEPITTPGKYYLHIFADAFTAEGDMPNMPIDLIFTVGEDTPEVSTDYAMKAQDVKGRTSSVVNIPIEMDNAEAVNAFQFDLYLPEGISVVSTMEDDEVLYDIAFNKDRSKSSHVLAVEPQANGALRVAAYSTSNASFVGNSGVLVNVAVAIEDIDEGDYVIAMRNIRMVTKDEEGNAVEKLGADNTATLTVENTLPGDVNSDGNVTMLDVVMTVNAVLEKVQKNFNANAADLNGDGQITMVDVVGVLQLVLTEGSSKAPIHRDLNRTVSMPELNACDLEFMGNGGVVLPVALCNGEDYSAFQLDVQLPAGVELADVALAGRAKASHTMAWNTLSDGTIRVVAYAVNNATFSNDEEALLNLVLKASDELKADAEVVLADGLFASEYGLENRAPAISVLMRSDATSVGGAVASAFRVYGTEGAVVVECGADAAVSIYTVTGKLVQQATVEPGKNIIPLPGGVYIVNGNKVIVK